LIGEAEGELNSPYTRLVEKTKKVSLIAANAKKSRSYKTDELLKAIGEMQEMQMSFNLQYLMLQNKVSQENRQFTMVSNIMKNKHDTAKNAINNIR
jgi:hypothetical protein